MDDIISADALWRMIRREAKEASSDPLLCAPSASLLDHSDLGSAVASLIGQRFGTGNDYRALFTRVANVPMDGFSEWLKTGLMEPTEIPPLVTHESVHFQQKYPLQGGLLCNCLKEGSADFLGELASGRLVKRMQDTHVWANTRERELWEQFQKDMPVANSTSRWLYGSSGGNGRPVDLGYWMGYKISEAHYKNSADKKQAVRDILIVKDCQQLLKVSRYAEKFAANTSSQK